MKKRWNKIIAVVAGPLIRLQRKQRSSMFGRHGRT
jgi:hypothetical protein